MLDIKANIQHSVLPVTPRVDADVLNEGMCNVEVVPLRKEEVWELSRRDSV